VKAKEELPSLRALTRELRQLQQRGPAARFATLWIQEGLTVGGVYAGWYADDPEGDVCYGREYVPGSVERECPKCAGLGVQGDFGNAYGRRCSECHGSGYVSVPTPFDATAAARRLLAAARDAQAHP
jgi:hypothetical protein